MQISLEKKRCSVCQDDSADVFNFGNDAKPREPICFFCIRQAASIIEALVKVDMDDERVLDDISRRPVHNVQLDEDDNRTPCPEGYGFGDFANHMDCFTECSLINDCRSKSKEKV